MAWSPAMHRTEGAKAVPAPTSASNSGSNSGTANQTSTAGSAHPHPEFSHESLGTQTIEGINAQGTRTTVTYATGTIGNDRPMTTVTETWMSPELQVMVLSKTSDPRNGETTTKLTNFSQSEPDAALFQVPADYTIQDQQQPAVAR